MAKKQKAVHDYKKRTGAMGEFTPPNSYVIAERDNLTRIAERFGTTIDDIMALNPHITDPDKIEAGDTIKIPATKKKKKSDVKPLQVGQLAYVGFGQAANAMRPGPSKESGKALAWIPAGGVVRIVGGPRSDDGVSTWWKVQSPAYNDREAAWSAGYVEGKGQYLFPYDPCEDEGIRIVQVAEE